MRELWARQCRRLIARVQLLHAPVRRRTQDSMWRCLRQRPKVIFVSTVKRRASVRELV